MSPPNQLDSDAALLAERLLGETREELGKADGKAQILLASTGVVVGVVLGSAIAGDWSPDHFHDCLRVCWWAGVGATAIGVAALAYAVFPRLLQSDDSRITYFEDVTRCKDTSELTDALNGEAARGDRDAEQLFRLSKVVHRKYAAIQTAMFALLAAITLCSIAALSS